MAASTVEGLVRASSRVVASDVVVELNAVRSPGRVGRWS